jgi:fructose/tagatose bisphosphate aldolase
MPLVNTAHILHLARSSSYCIGAFNIVDYPTLEAVVRSAKRQNAPAIIQTSSGTVKRYTPAALVEWSRRLADQYDAQICLHLDHGTEPALIQAAVYSKPPKSIRAIKTSRILEIQMNRRHLKLHRASGQ